MNKVKTYYMKPVRAYVWDGVFENGVTPLKDTDDMDFIGMAGILNLKCPREEVGVIRASDGYPLSLAYKGDYIYVDKDGIANSAKRQGVFEKRFSSEITDILEELVSRGYCLNSYGFEGPATFPDCGTCAYCRALVLVKGH